MQGNNDGQNTYGTSVKITQIVLLPQRSGNELCGDVPADVLHINKTFDPFGTPRPPTQDDLNNGTCRPNTYALNGVSTTLPACDGAPTSIARLDVSSSLRSFCRRKSSATCSGAPDTCGLPAGANPTPNKALIGAAAGSCVAVALVALVLCMYVWHRHRTAVVACILGPKGHMRGAAGRPPGSRTREQAATFVLPPLAVRAGSLPLRVRPLAHSSVCRALLKIRPTSNFQASQTNC